MKKLNIILLLIILIMSAVLLPPFIRSEIALHKNRKELLTAMDSLKKIINNYNIKLAELKAKEAAENA